MFFKLFGCVGFSCTSSKSDESDSELARRLKQKNRTLKIILLGPGDSGKSTFLKQIKSINGEERTQYEKEYTTRLVYCNILRGIRILYDLAIRMGFKFSDSSNIDLGMEVLGISSIVPEELDYDRFKIYVPAIKRLWADSALQMAFANRKDLILADSVKYFLDNLDQISKKNYIATRNDALRCRKITKGISEYACTVKNVPFVFIDIGGQRSQRRIWYTLFENMVGVIFMVPSSDFDRVIIEDRKTNAVVEALNIFKAIIQSSKLRNCAIVVNFNKVDILVEKIKLKNIDEYLPNFVGDPRNIDDVKNFYINTFSAVVPEYLSPDFFFTNSLDRKNIKNTFNIIKQNVLNFNMKKLLHE